MKKILAIIMTAVMTLSAGVTAFAATAYPSNDKIAVDGTEFYMQPYTINGYNYFKLRAVCGILQGTPNEFDLNWNSGENKTVIWNGPLNMPIISMDYDGVFRNQTAHPVDAVMEVDGRDVTLQAYNINGYNYFKLRDLAELIGFEVGWNNATKTVNIICKERPVVQPNYGKSPEVKNDPVQNPPVQTGPVVRDQAVLVSVKEGQKKMLENTTFNDQVLVSFHDFDGVAVFKDCTFNDNIYVEGDYDPDKSLILENCKVNGAIIQRPKWK